MGFQEVTSLDADVTIKLGGVDKKTKKANPTSAEGYYLGSRTVQTKMGPGELHFLQTADGNVAVWGKRDLNRKLGSVTPGTMVRLSFVSMVPTPTGEMYKYKVETDSSNTIEVAANLGGNESHISGADEDDGDDAPTIAPAAVSVADMLKNRKKA